MEARPLLRPTSTLTDKLLEAGSGLVLLASWGLAVWAYTRLPATIPIHYNATGAADNFGSKTFILLLPLLATGLWTALSVLNQHPHLFNYPAPITAHNARASYTVATRLLRCLKLLVVLVFGGAVVQIVRHPDGQADSFSPWFLPVMGAAFFGTLLFFIGQLRKAGATPGPALQ